MTYRTLLKQLKELDEKQLDMDVTVFVSGVDEFYPAKLAIIEGSDVLEDNHPYLRTL